MPQCQSENGWWQVEAYTKVGHRPVTKRVWAATKEEAIDTFDQTFGYRYTRPFAVTRDPNQTVAPHPKSDTKRRRQPPPLPLLDLLSSAPA